MIPALAVEILSPATRKTDLADKEGIYREAGIEEHWIFDRDKKTARVYCFAESQDEPAALKSFDDILTPPLPPGFSLEMPRIRQALRMGSLR